jgi:hypothetical protein
MATSGTLKLILLGQAVELPVEELDPEISPHTGRSLRRVSVTFPVAAEGSDEVNDALAAARKPEGALKDEGGSSWLVTESSYSYSNHDPVHRFSVHLRENEEIEAERLELLGLQLKPTKYREEARGGGIYIVTVVKPDTSTDEALEKAITEQRDDIYFNVLRVGVSEKALRMRFGLCLWQKTDAGRAHLLRFVSEEGDNEEVQRGLGLYEPMLGRIARKAVAAEEVTNALLSELQSSGVLSETVISAIRSRAGESWGKHWRELYETDDLDLHFG